MVQNKLPLINSAHGSETRNIINELIKLFNGMGYTYNESLQKAQDVLNEAQKTNDMNVDVQNQLDNLVIESGNANAEVSQARGGFPLLKDRFINTEKVFRWKKGGTVGSEHVVNVIEGYEGNDVAPATRGATISGGGGIGQGNVIGGFTHTAVPGNIEENVIDPSVTNAHYAVIAGGYNSVNNALAGVLTGFHCVIEKEATHGTISGGSVHKILDGDYSTISGGTGHTIDVKDGGAYATIAGGHTNKITGKMASIGGGWKNDAAGELSSISGGQLNKIESSAYAGNISGGHRNTVSGNQALIAGGQQNVASGSSSVVIGGRNNVASGQDSLILGGGYNEAEGKSTILKGSYARGINEGQEITGLGTFSGGYGEAQLGKIGLRTETTDGTTKALGINGTSFGINIDPNVAFNFKIMIVAKSSGDAKAWKIEGLIMRKGSSNAQLVGTPEVTVISNTEGAETWNATVLEGATTLNTRVTGQAGKNIKWVASVETVEVLG